MSIYQHRSTLRVLEILNVLSNSQNGNSLTELTKILKIPKSSLYPIIQTMNNEGYLSLNKETSKFKLGSRILALSASYLKKNNILDVLKDEMQKLVNKVSETCQLAILKENEVLYLLKIDSSESIRLVSKEGSKLPAYCTSLGKALLSDCSLKDLENLYPNKLEKVTPNTVNNVEELYNQILEIKEVGVAHENEEVSEYVQCYAVPIKKENNICMAVSISIPTFRVSLKKEKIKKGLLELKKNIEKILINCDSFL